jgi:hypothetical protein
MLPNFRFRTLQKARGQKSVDRGYPAFSLAGENATVETDETSETLFFCTSAPSREVGDSDIQRVLTGWRE